MCRVAIGALRAVCLCVLCTVCDVCMCVPCACVPCRTVCFLKNINECVYFYYF